MSTASDRALSSSGIITIVCFSVFAICVCVCAVYLLVQDKNISDIVEDIDDSGCNFLNFSSPSDKMMTKSVVQSIVSSTLIFIL